VMGTDELPDAPTEVTSAMRSFQFISWLIVDCRCGARIGEWNEGRLRSGVGFNELGHAL
jgi:hypothetical protein